MKNIVFIVFCFLLFSCSTVKTSMTETREISRDSVSSQVNDSSYLVPVPVAADSAWINALLECDQNGKVLMRQLEIVRGQRVNPTFELRDNIIRIRIPVDSSEVYAIYKNRFEKVVKTQKKSTVTLKEDAKVVYKTPFKAIFLSFLVGFFLAVILVILNKFFKIIPL